MSLPLRLALFAALLSPVSSPLAEACAAPGSLEELSLEELLERYRAERERLFESYRGRVSALISDLETAQSNGKRAKLADFREELVKLGPGATPLLVPYLDPGVNASAPARGRARQVALAMSEVSTRAVTTELLELLEKGTEQGRDNALRVLGHSEDLDRVGPVLRERFAKAPAEEKGKVLSAIASMGGPENEAFLGGVLADKDPAVVKLALEALADSSTSSAAPRILEFLGNPQAAAPQAVALVRYYRACPSVLDGDHCEALLGLVENILNQPSEAVLVLELLSDAHEEWSSKFKRRLKDLSGATTPRIEEAALIALARDGDRGARKQLLDPLDDRVDENESLPSAWENRGEMRYKIGDYKNAIKDYTEALKRGEAYGRPRPDLYVGLARCHAQLGKDKDAAEWLDKAPISISELRELAKDPVFASLVESDRYREVFHLKED